MRFYYIFLFVLVLLFSCEKNDIENINKRPIDNKYTHTLEEADTLEFDIDEKTNYTSPYIRYYDHIEEDYLLYADFLNRRLLIYDYEEKTLFKIIKFDKDGPNGISDVIVAGEIVSWDSIFVSGRNPFEIYLTDTTGVIKNTYSTLVDNNKRKSPWLDIRTYTPINFLGKNLILSYSPISFDRSPAAYSKAILLSFNVDTKEMNYLPISYPNVYKKGNWHSLFENRASTTYNGEKIILSFPVSDSIHVWSKKDGVKTHLAKSNLKTDFEYRTKKPEQGKTKEFNRYQANTPMYPYITYDKYRNIYYRFFLGKTEESKTIASNPLNLMADKEASIIILDDEFNKIGEYTLKENKHEPRVFFVSKDGLCISNNHYKNPNLNEDKLSFTLFSLKKISSQF